MLKFYCHACLEDKTIGEQSPDSRYCQGCCEFLLQEARLIEGKRHPAWIPKVYKAAPPSTPEPSQKRVEQVRDCDKIGEGNHDRVRGRKPLDIPIELINRLGKEGFMSCRTISQKLRADYGINCSYRTVARRL